MLKVMLMAILFGATAAWADPAADCHQNADLDLRIRGLHDLDPSKPP
jgi:hypothetical protein